MTIRRAALPDANFYILRNEISGDQRLGWAARGLLIYLLSKPASWKVSIQNLINETADSAQPLGRDGVYSILRQLMDAGYVKRIQIRDGGKIVATEYEVGESVEPHTPEPDAVKTIQERTDTKKTDVSKITETDNAAVGSLFGDDPVEDEKPVPRGTRFNREKYPRLPDNWLTEALRLGVTDPEALHEFERFADYWGARAGKEGRKADWLATWRNRCRDIVKWKEERRHGRSGNYNGSTPNGDGGPTDRLRAFHEGTSAVPLRPV